MSDLTVIPIVDSNKAMMQTHDRSLLTVVPNLAFPPTPMRTRQLRKAPVNPTKHKQKANNRPSCQVQAISDS